MTFLIVAPQSNHWFTVLAKQLEAANSQLKLTLKELADTQTQLIQTEKMSSLWQLVAGIAYEINNPVSFIYGNIGIANEYTENLDTLRESIAGCPVP